MELLTLLHKLENYGPKVYGSQNYGQDLQTVRLLVCGQTSFDSSVLYITDSTRLPRPEQCGDFTVICIGNREDFSTYADITYTLVCLSCDVSFQEMFNTIQMQITEVQQITAGMHIMVNALFSNKGLQYLVDTASKVFGNPVYVVDLQKKYLAISSGVFSDNTFLHAENAAGYISDEGMNFIRSQKLDEKVRNSDSPYYFHNTLCDESMLIDAVLMQEIEVAHIMVQESEHPFNEFDHVLLHRFAQLVSMELQKDSTFNQNKEVMYSYFLADLIKNPDVNTGYVRDRLRLLGYNLKEDLYILVIPSNSYHAAKIRLEVIVAQVRNILVGSIYVIYEDCIVFLISKERYKGFSQFEVKRLTEFLSANNLKAGISNFFGHLEDTKRFYQQALQAVNMGMKLKKSDAVFYYQDYYLYQMFENSEKTDPEIRFLIHPGLMSLYNYDHEKSTDFISTLQEYLVHPGQPAIVAENLHVHKNTLLYRMKKIKEITHCNFDEGVDYMNFALSFRIMEYLHML